MEHFFNTTFATSSFYDAKSFIISRKLSWFLDSLGHHFPYKHKLGMLNNECYQLKSFETLILHNLIWTLHMNNIHNMSILIQQVLISSYCVVMWWAKIISIVVKKNIFLSIVNFPQFLRLIAMKTSNLGSAWTFARSITR